MPKPTFGTYIVLLSREDDEKVKREAAESGMAPEAWIAWLVHDYAPPEELARETEGLV